MDQIFLTKQGKEKTRKHRVTVIPADSFSAVEIREIRRGTGLTQELFARCMGVSVKTVEAWEAGKNRPKGSSRRLLTLMREDPMFPQKAGFIQM